MKSPGVAVFALIAMFMLAGSVRPVTASSPSRLGLNGRMVFVITEITPLVGNSELKEGDVITDIVFEEQENPSDPANQCDGLTSIESLQQATSSSRVGAPVRVEFLRFDPLRGDFEKHIIIIKTLAHPASQSGSTLGLIGEMGFMINGIDPSIQQAEVRQGDIMLSLESAGQITDLKTFRTFISTREVNTTVRAEVLRYHAAPKTTGRITIVLKVFPYPSTPQSASTSTPKTSLSFVSKISNRQDPCRNNPCVWCCAQCAPFPWSSSGGSTQCETGRINCRPSEPGIRCRLDFCV